MWHLAFRGRGILYSQIRHAKKRSAVGCWPSQRLLLKFPLKYSRRISFVREQVDLLMNLNEGKSLRLLLLPHFYFSDTYLKYFYFFETTRLYGDIADWIIYNFQAIRLNIFANVLSSSIEPYLKDIIVFDRKLNDLVAFILGGHLLRYIFAQKQVSPRLLSVALRQPIQAAHKVELNLNEI